MRVPRVLRSKLTVAFVVALVSVAVLGATTSATAAVRTFAGTTSQGQPISFTVQGSAGSIAITDMAVTTVLTCADGQGITASHSFAGFNIPVVNGRFQFDYFSVFFSLHWSGRVSATTSSGSLTDLYPGLTVDEQAQLCPTGDLTWTATPQTNPTGSASRVDVRIDARRDASGHVTTSIARSEG